MTQTNPWFAPKRYGIGAGLPVHPKGWALLAAHGALLVTLAAGASARPGLLLLAAIAPLPLYAAKTRGGWRWRWGEGA